MKELNKIESKSKYIIWLMGLFLIQMVCALILATFSPYLVVWFIFSGSITLAAILAIVIVGLFKLRKL